MKRYILIVTGILFLGFTDSKAQNEMDALRYSQNYPVGTARSAGLGGAIGAVGGDFTSLSVNPAGIGLYRGSEFTVSPVLSFNSVRSDFLNNNYTEDNYNLSLGNLGLVLNNPTGRESGWISTSFGIGFNQLNNYNRDIFMGGIQTNSSFLDNLVFNAGTLPAEDLNPYYEQLAFDTYMIDWDENNGEYFNDFADGGYGQYQERSLQENGSLSEYTISFGANYNHKVYIGGTMGIKRVRFEQTIRHSESDRLDEIAFTDRFTFEEFLNTRGTGYTFKLGAIVRPANFIRLGAAFHLPDFYYLNDEYETSMESYIDPEEGYDNPQYASSGYSEYSYQLRTPAKAVGSVVLTFAQKGMISMDYEYLNYKNADLSADDYSFTEENSDIEAIYRAVHNLRLGGEYRFGPAYLRGGYAYYASPFATQESDVDASRQILSAGLGLRNQFFSIDASYTYTMSESMYYPYVPGIVEGAFLSDNTSSVMLSLGFRF